MMYGKMCYIMLKHPGDNLLVWEFIFSLSGIFFIYLAKLFFDSVAACL